MLIKNSYQLKSSGFAAPDSAILQQMATALRQLKSDIKPALVTHVAQPSLTLYRQNPLIVGVVAGFSIVSLLIVTLIFALAGGKPDASSSFFTSQIDESGFGNEVSQAKIKYELSLMALNFMEGEAWNKQTVADFTQGWNRLDVLNQAEMKHTVWFQSLENYLQRKSGAGDSRAKWRTELSAQLGLQEAAQDVAVASAPAASQATQATVSMAAVEEVSQTPSRSDSASPSASSPTSVATESVAQLTQAVEPLKTTVEIAAPVTQASATQSVENSNAQALAKPSDAVQPQTTAQPQNTAQQQTTTIQPSKVTGTQVVNAPQSITAQSATGGRVNRVIRTPMSEQASVAAPSVATAASVATEVQKPVPIGDAELRSLTREFIKSYETGNIINFTSLFSDKAVSNDEADLDTIRKEYASLFAATSDRRMLIGDISWKLSDNTATGEGKLAVSLRSKGASQNETYSGIVKIVVEKQKDGVQITKLYHSLQ